MITKPLFAFAKKMSIKEAKMLVDKITKRGICLLQSIAELIFSTVRKQSHCDASVCNPGFRTR